ncbi:peptidase family M49-domain-containing protein [Daldinia loculata]|uniref:peptidase family M49-domain-containing protein n=1 Tax=Daldinia loculata TaxID=103429 RepID=UPI0020C45779|nr:peptidase family M49-domain-containing protein [Daldinia loculata]KAI1648082.1 peptidase family M49-domain-containing protein [Daldinia loculata]
MSFVLDVSFRILTPGKVNFDHNNPLISPVTGKSVRTWYKPGETWNGVFGKLAPAMEECRAFLIASYLACHNDVLSWCGYDRNSSISQDDCECSNIMALYRFN